MPSPRPSHGGRRTPAKPAMSSGPGALAQRTDGGPARAVSKMLDGTPADQLGTFGTKTQLQGIQAAMPSGPPGGPQNTSTPGEPQRYPGLFDPTMNPGEPLTAGASMGPGPGPQNIPLMADQETDVIRAMLLATNGHPDVVRLAMREGLL